MKVKFEINTSEYQFLVKEYNKYKIYPSLTDYIREKIGLASKRSDIIRKILDYESGRVFSLDEENLSFEDKEMLKQFLISNSIADKYNGMLIRRR